MIENIKFLLPEIILVASAFIFLMYGVFSKPSNSIKVTGKIFTFSALSCLLVVGSLLFLNNERLDTIFILSNSYVFDGFTVFTKNFVALVAFAIFACGISNKFYAGTNHSVFEFPVLILLSVCGAFLVISANSLLIFYIGLELMSLATYVLVAVNRDNEKAAEAGIKYFILGALASAIILFGISLIYGYSGTLNLDQLLISHNSEFSLDNKLSPAISLGITLILTGIFFKISAAPMHMWAPDIYEGASKIAVMFISTIPKIAMIAFLINFIKIIPAEEYSKYSMIIFFAASLSMLVGSFAALKQDDIKRLLAYSSIANMGYILIPLISNSSQSISAILIYLVIYVISVVGVFSILSIFSKSTEDLGKVPDLAGISKLHPVYALCLAILFFSIAGIPPLAGFWGKFYVFKEAISSENYLISVIGIIASLVACFYYLRIIKTMYFDEYTLGLKTLIARNVSILTKLVIFACIVFILTCTIYISFLQYAVESSILNHGIYSISK